MVNDFLPPQLLRSLPFPIRKKKKKKQTPRNKTFNILSPTRSLRTEATIKIPLSITNYIESVYTYINFQENH